MGIASDILWHNGLHRKQLERTQEQLQDVVNRIEAHFVENDVDYEPFDPEATWN